MSELEEQDFIKDYLTWMKGPVVQFESLHIYNFGYQRALPLPSIALSPESKVRFNLQTSGMQIPSRRFIVVIGDKYLGRYQDIMQIIDTIQEDMNPAALVGKYIKRTFYIKIYRIILC